jgi:hypothetical protein
LLRSAEQYFLTSGQDGKAVLIQLWQICFPHYIEALPDEVDVDLLSDMIESFRDCLEIAGENSLSVDQLAQVSKVVDEIMEDYSERMKLRTENGPDQDADAEETERLQEEHDQEEDLLLDIADLSGKLVKFFKTAFLTTMQATLLPRFIHMLEPASPAHERQVALCVFDDIIEYAPNESLQIYDAFFPAMLNYLVDPHPGVRQAAAYGVGVSAHYLTARFAPSVNVALESLFRAVALPEARAEDNSHAAENGISAIGKILRNKADAIDTTRVLPAWISFLPVVEDKIESQIVYDNLLFFLETDPFRQTLFGSNLELSKKILAVFAHVVGTDLISDTHKERIRSLLKTWHLFCLEQFTHSFEALSPEDKAKIQSLST